MRSVTYRPRALLATAILLSLIIVGSAVFGWYALPPDIRSLFTGFQVVTLLAILGGLVAVMLWLASSFVRADEQGLTFRNGPRRHVVPWSEVRGIQYDHSDSWAHVLVDGEQERWPLLGIQRNDGARAKQAVEDLRERWATAR